MTVKEAKEVILLHPDVNEVVDYSGNNVVYVNRDYVFKILDILDLENKPKEENK